MSQLLEFLHTHEEAFRSRARLASLYSDFRTQRHTNPEGYDANSRAWRRALAHATRAGVIPATTTSSDGTSTADRFVLHAGPALQTALSTRELGRPLALGAVLADGVAAGDAVPLRAFLTASKPFGDGGGGAAGAGWRGWVPSAGQIVEWGWRQMGFGGAGRGGEGGVGLEKEDWVFMANVEDAANKVLDAATKIVTSDASSVYTTDLFNSTFAPSLGLESLSKDDSAVLLTFLSRDRAEIAYLPSKGVVKFKTNSTVKPAPISEEDVSIASLRGLIASLEAQVQQLSEQIATRDKEARDAVSNKQTNTAKRALRQKRLADTRLQQRTATLSQLEEIYVKIEQAADQVEIVKVMEASSKTLQSLNKQTGGVEKVQDVMDSLREEMANADEIGQAINEVSAGDVDETEVEDEFEALEKVEKEKQDAVERQRREAREAVERETQQRRMAEGVEETRQKLADLDGLGKSIPDPDDKAKEDVRPSVSEKIAG